MNQWSNPGTVIVAGLEAFLIIFSACTLAFMAVYSLTWPACLAFAQFAIRGHTPVRLMRFLEDARQRDILRTAGPVYQFRHARLQDHLARQAGQRTLWPPSR